MPQAVPVADRLPQLRRASRRSCAGHDAGRLRNRGDRDLCPKGSERKLKELWAHSHSSNWSPAMPMCGFQCPMRSADPRPPCRRALLHAHARLRRFSSLAKRQARMYALSVIPFASSSRCFRSSSVSRRVTGAIFRREERPAARTKSGAALSTACPCRLIG